MNLPPVVVYTAAGQIQASVVKGMLEAAGIPAEFSREGAGEAYELTVGTLGLVDVLVPGDRAAEAEALIAAMERGELESDEEMADPGEPPAEA